MSGIVKFESSQHDTWSVCVYPCCQKLHAVHTLMFLCSQKIKWFSRTWFVELRAVWAGNNPPRSWGESTGAHLENTFLKHSSAAWRRPWFFKHRPFRRWITQRSSTEYSFSVEDGGRIISTADTQVCHVISFLIVYSYILGEKGLIWHVLGYVVLPGDSSRARSTSTKVCIMPSVSSGHLLIILKPFHMYIIS